MKDCTFFQTRILKKVMRIIRQESYINVCMACTVVSKYLEEFSRVDDLKIPKKEKVVKLCKNCTVSI